MCTLKPGKENPAKLRFYFGRDKSNNMHRSSGRLGVDTIRPASEAHRRLVVDPGRRPDQTGPFWHEKRRELAGAPVNEAAARSQRLPNQE